MVYASAFDCIGQYTSCIWKGKLGWQPQIRGLLKCFSYLAAKSISYGPLHVFRQEHSEYTSISTFCTSMTWFRLSIHFSNTLKPQSVFLFVLLGIVPSTICSSSISLLFQSIFNELTKWKNLLSFTPAVATIVCLLCFDFIKLTLYSYRIQGSPDMYISQNAGWSYQLILIVLLFPSSVIEIIIIPYLLFAYLLKSTLISGTK